MTTLTRDELIMDFTVDGTSREALVFGPAPIPAALTAPIVFAFHGHGGNMKDTAGLMGIEAQWLEAVVVYPQGLIGRPSPVDPNGERSGWQVEADQPSGVGNQDLQFFDAMLAGIGHKYSLDPKRVYVTGFSNGAIFSYLLWAQRGKKLAAVGECAGRLWQSEHLSIPRPLLAIAGEGDHTDPFDKQLQTIEYARQIDHATGPGQSCGQYCTFYPSTLHTPVKAYIHPGAHVYPAWAPHEIVTFFKAHPQP